MDAREILNGLNDPVKVYRALRLTETAQEGRTNWGRGYLECQLRADLALAQVEAERDAAMDRDALDEFIEEAEVIAREHGVVAALDHLGLDGLANIAAKMYGPPKPPTPPPPLKETVLADVRALLELGDSAILTASEYNERRNQIRHQMGLPDLPPTDKDYLQ